MPTEDELQVHFINVGQGDSILIDLQDIEVLIDGGDRTPGVVTYLNQYVDGALEVMVATHPHADHIGGSIAVLDAFTVNQIWYNGETSTSKTYSDFMNSINAEGAEVHTARLHDVIKAGSLELFVHHPADLSGSTNNNSIVLHLAYGDIDFLFAGDAEQEAEGNMMMLSSVRLPEVEILKVGHHGSRTASSADFLSITSPEIAIYMAGEGNTYGHPHQETLEALSQIGAKIYGTDVHGTIVVTTDGQTYDLQLEKQAPPVKPVTVTPSPTPTTTPTPSPTPSTETNVKITKIFYDGIVPSTESDEYVEITNLGEDPVDLAGWVVKDISEGYPSLTFPSYILQSGESVRVYTNENHPEYGGFSFGSGKAVWNNSDPDTAALYNAQGQEVSRKSY
jgi:competence protein ComEC